MTRRRWRELLRAPVSRVASGSAFGQLALALSIPFVSRLYGAEEIGSFAVALSVSQLAAIVTTGRAEQVLPRALPENRWALCTLVAGASVVSIPVVAVACWLLAAPGGALGIAALTVATSLFNLSGFVFLAQKDFAGLARSRGINGVATGSLQVLGGLLVPSVSSLAVTYALGSLVAASMCWPAARSMRAESTTGPRAAVKDERLVRFVASVGPSGLLSNAALAMPTLGIAGLFGLDRAGTFFLARRVLMVPSQLVARTLSDVNYAELADRPQREVLGVLQRWLRGFRWPALLVVVGGLATAPAMPLIVGDGYPDIAITMAVLVVPSVVQLVAVSFSNILLVLEREYLTLLWNAVRVCGMLGLYALFVWWTDYLWNLILYSAYLVLIYGALLWLVHRLARKRAST